MAQTFMKAINAEITVIFFYIQLHNLIGITTGRQNLSVGFMPLFLIILFGTIGFYILKSRKSK